MNIFRAASLVFLSATACAHAPLPDDGAERALYRDLQRMVTLADSAGWDIDRYELDELLPGALLSVCRVDTTRQDRLLDWLALRETELGGPVASAWAQRGRDLAEVEELLELSRIQALLRRAINARTQDCPFWLEPENEFVGRQIADDRFQVLLATGGKMILVNQGGRVDINFGGAGRLLIGRTFGTNWGVYLGLEAGAVASFPPSEDGGRSSLVLGLDGVVPVVVRYRFVNTYVELGAGYLAHITESGNGVENGIHVGVAVGGIATRQLLFFPGAGFAASYERTLPRASQSEVLQTIKLGFRVSLDINL